MNSRPSTLTVPGRLSQAILGPGGPAAAEVRSCRPPPRANDNASPQADFDRGSERGVSCRGIAFRSRMPAVRVHRGCLCEWAWVRILTRQRMIQGTIPGASSGDPFGSVAGMRQRLRGEDYRVREGGSTGKTSHFLHLVAGSMQPVVGQPSAVQNFFSRQARTADKRTSFVRRVGGQRGASRC